MIVYISVVRRKFTHLFILKNKAQYTIAHAYQVVSNLNEDNIKASPVDCFKIKVPLEASDVE